MATDPKRYPVLCGNLNWVNVIEKVSGRTIIVITSLAFDGRF
jgi:hypothetical protein